MNALPDTPMHLSLLQHRSVPGDTGAAINRLDKAAALSAAAGSSLLLTPECGMTGYNMTQGMAADTAFAADGPEAEQIAELARIHGIAIHYGYIECSGDDRYNSVQLVDAKGESILRYRKTHLWGGLDRALFKAGDAFAPVIDFQGWKISTLICYDVEFAETTRSLALSGAHLVLVPTALMQPFRFIAQQMIPVRAAENQVYIAYANLVGQEQEIIYEGCSTVAAPDGAIVASAPAEEEALLHMTLDPDTLRNARLQLPYYRDRRPELYQALSNIDSHSGHD